jgi:GrpB-like predicted nucleotidyltransferase (UPF0157 family)
MKLEDNNPIWEKEFNKEVELIKSVLEPDEIIDIQHIGSTAIKNIKAKPILDIAVLVSPDEYIQSYVRPLNKIGYTYYPESSSSERLFFRKGEPAQFHLSLTQEGVTPFWDRQILFRDYLNTHPEAAKEYEALKEQLIKSDPSAGQEYTDGKTLFVLKILEQAKK